MYLENEKPVKWHDNRNSPRVIFLNVLLDSLFAKQLCHKAYHKVMSSIRSRFQKNRTAAKLEAGEPA
jgi:hypothetical protein